MKRLKREKNRILARLKDKVEGFKRLDGLAYTGLSSPPRLCGGLEHLKIETRLIDETFECVMGECVI
jgi:hypothetical protein